MVNTKCAVATCSVSSKDKILFYCFPKNPTKNQKWIEACQRPPEEGFVPNAGSRICAKHFLPDDFLPNRDPRGRLRLKDGVIPTQNLEIPEAMPELMNVDLSEMVTLSGHQQEAGIVIDNYGAMDSDGGTETVMVKVEPPSYDEDYSEPPRKYPKVTKQKLAELPADKEVESSTLSKKENLELQRIVDEDNTSMTDKEKIKLLATRLDSAYKKNATMVKKNKSLRLQLFAANKKTLSQKAKMDIAKEVLSPFFTTAQIDCFCRPSWLRSRNWGNEDFDIAIALRKLMSKRAFSYLRKKRLVPMPSLTSLRKYYKINGIVMPNAPNPRGGSSTKTPAGKKMMVTSAYPKKKKIKIDPHGQSQALLYEQIAGSDPNTAQYIVVQDPNIKTEVKGPQVLTLESNDILQQVGDNVEFLQQTTDEATGEVIATIMTTSDGSNRETVQMVSVDDSGEQNQYTIVQTRDGEDQAILSTGGDDMSNMMTLKYEGQKEGGKSKEPGLSFIHISN